MKLIIRGKGSIELNQADFAAQGGEGAVYVKGDMAFKVYTDPAKMIPPAKIQELSALNRPNIIRPQEILLDQRLRPVGYAMRRVQTGLPLCAFYTRAFRERKGVTPELIARLVQKLREGVQYIHENGILIVDLNEMNLLVDLPLREVLFIDTDSYQTPSFPATAIMDSIRDRHTTGFNENTDWFAFGILSFQLFVGIHPYKGKHPDVPGLDARMQQNVSVFNKKVSLPKVCYPIGVIPAAYREWFHAVFEKGMRFAPPEQLTSILTLPTITPQTVKGETIRFCEPVRFPAEILQPIDVSHDVAALTTDGLFVNNARCAVPSEAEIVLTPCQRALIAAWVEDDRLRLFDVAADRFLDSVLRAEALTRYDERLYVKCGDGLYEVTFLELPMGTHAALQRIGNVLPNATRLYEGVAFQSLLGACYVGLFPESGVYHAVRAPELDAYTVIGARFDHGVLIVLGVRNGTYDQLILRFDAAYRGYDTRFVADVGSIDINFVTLPSGVCARLTDESDLELFFRHKDSYEIKRIRDSALQGGRLFGRGAQLLCGRESVLYRLILRAD